jgi:DNA polymerase III delta subunit
MAKASATDQAHVVLAVGKEAILVQRVIEGVMASARKTDPAAVRQDIVASNESAAGELANALSPSLFGELTVIVVQGIDGATDDVGAILLTAIDRSPGTRSLGDNPPRRSQGQEVTGHHQKSKCSRSSLR